MMVIFHVSLRDLLTLIFVVVMGFIFWKQR